MITLSNKQKNVGQAKLKSDKADFRTTTKNITVLQNDFFITIKRSFPHMDIKIVVIYGPNIKALNYMNEKLIELLENKRKLNPK